MPFKDKLHTRKLEPHEDGYDKGDERMLTQPLRYSWTRKNSVFRAIPGAINNGASIPSIIPDFILDDHGKIDKPAVIHDDIYWAYRDATKEQRVIWEQLHGTWTKSDADLQFYDGCKDEGMWWWRCSIVHAGVKGNVIAKYKWGRNS